MKIIFTKSFKKDFLKEFKRYNVTISDLLIKLNKFKPIYLKNPFFKAKFDINWVSLRGIIVINDIKTIIPLYFVLKKDKKDWENIILDKSNLAKINNIFEKYSQELTLWEYEIFDI